MKILGIHDGHNGSACLLDDGKIIAVYQEERLHRKKNYFGFPFNSIERILSENNYYPNDIDYIALNGKHMPPFFGDINNLLQTYHEMATIKGKVKKNSQLLIKKTPIYQIYKSKIKEKRIENLKQIGFSKNQIHFIDHHTAHASATYYCCPWFKDEKVLVLTNDGAGDGICATISIGDNNKLFRISQIPETESIAWYYGMLTMMMGMIPNEHEYKIMGLAPYSPNLGKELGYNRFKNIVKFPNDFCLEWQRGKKVPPAAKSYPFLRTATELLRFDWIAAGIQKWVEEIATEWVKRAICKTGITKIALSGGFFMNVKVNKSISNLNELNNLYIFPSCGDESNCIGSALALYADKNFESNGDFSDINPLDNIYLGNSIENQDVVNCFPDTFFNVKKFNDINIKIGNLLAEGKIVARCQDRMEFGARALGNRSILADASSLDVIRTINKMIKNRDFWMPFAPTILSERSYDYIINPKKIDSPYMMLAFDSTDLGKKELIAASHLEDSTLRAQILERNHNINYYKVLKEFERITGKGGLLNTSFNLHGYPIVSSTEDAYHVFNNSNLEYLAIGDYIISKR